MSHYYEQRTDVRKLDNRNREKRGVEERHMGLVITFCTGNLVRNHVIELGDKGENRKAWIVVADAFRVSPFLADDDLLYQKNAQRRAERPLLPGEVISWSDNDGVNNNGDIIAFERERPVYETRHVSCHQFRVLGALEPNTDKFWVSSLPRLTITKYEHLQFVEPDVMIYAWIAFEIELNLDVKLEFIAFDCVAHEDSLRIIDAPWHGRTPLLREPESSDDEWCGLDVIPPKQPKRPINFIKEKWDLVGEIGWASSERTMYSPKIDVRGIRFWVPLGKNGEMPIAGFPYTFSASYDSVTRRYVVTNFKNNYTCTPVVRTNHGSLITSVTECDRFPGLYTCPLFGFVRDPLGIITIVPFTPYGKNSIRLAIREEMDDFSMGNFLRMYVTEFDENHKELVDDYVKRTEICVRNCEGIVINNSVIYCKRYPNVAFWRLANESREFVIGQRVKFDAIYVNDPRDRQFYVVRWENVLDDARKPIVVEHNFGMYKEDTSETQTIFCTVVSGAEKYSNIAESAEFGLVDVGEKLGLSDKTLESYHVWVIVEVVERKDAYFDSRLDMKLIGFGHHKPPCKRLTLDAEIRQKELALLTLG